jgi:hypothetical protein
MPEGSNLRGHEVTQLPIRLRVRGPLVQGGYDLFLDDELVSEGVSAAEAARYVNDAWLYGGAVLSEYLDGAGRIETVLPPAIVSALQARGALPRAASPEGLHAEEA